MIIQADLTPIHGSKKNGTSRNRTHCLAKYLYLGRRIYSYAYSAYKKGKHRLDSARYRLDPWVSGIEFRVNSTHCNSINGNEATTTADCGVDVKLFRESFRTVSKVSSLKTSRLAFPIITLRKSAIISLGIETSGLSGASETLRLGTGVGIVATARAGSSSAYFKNSVATSAVGNNAN